jgi:serine/threonine protein kinase
VQRLAAYGEPVDGTPFGRYRLIELLGRGGMGEVWRAYDTVTDRIVAIKLLPANFSENEEFQQRFRREAHAAARLNTPHVIPIYDYGEIDGRLFVSMRLIEGRDLQAVLADGPLEPSGAVHIIEQAALALQAAHEVGLMHRDVKPSNILLDRNDFAYLIDFGIARAADDTRLTQSGNAIGTFAYIAPERLDARAKEDARADIYSLACVLFECLTGHPPFDADTMPQVIAAHLHAPPPQPSTTRPNVPAQIDPVIAKGMAKDPHNRYATTVELAHAARGAITTPLAPPSERTLLDDAALTTPAPEPAAQQQPADLNLAPTQQRPPGWPPVPQPRPADRPPAQIGTPPPWWAPPQQPPQPAPARRSATPWIIAGVAAAVVVVLVTYLITRAYTNKTASQTAASASQTAGSASETAGSASQAAGSASQAPPPSASAAPVMSGHYIETDTATWGQVTTNDWYFTPCGDGCADAGFGRARLVSGQWTMDAISDALCGDGSTRVPSAIASHFVWDPNTLAGTEAITVKVAECGRAPGTTWTDNIQLRQAG